MGFGCGSEQAARGGTAYARGGGRMEAQLQLGCRYQSGYRVIENFIAHAKWLEKAADQGMVQARYRLGTLFEEGGDKVAAFSEYRRAAFDGLADAQRRYGVFYSEAW